MIEQLSRDEGTIEFKFHFTDPPTEFPAAPATMLTHFTDDLRANVTLLPDGKLRFMRVRGTDDGGHVEIDVSPLIGSSGWHMFLSWSPAGPSLAVGDIDGKHGLIHSDDGG